MSPGRVLDSPGLVGRNKLIGGRGSWLRPLCPGESRMAPGLITLSGNVV
jgi:hypothetical protein